MANNISKRSSSYKGAFIASLIINISLVALIVIMFTTPDSPFLTSSKEPSSTDVIDAVAQEYSGEELADEVAPETSETTTETTTTTTTTTAAETTRSRSKTTSRTQAATTTTTAAPTTTTTTAPPIGDNDGDYTDFF